MHASRHLAALLISAALVTPAAAAAAPILQTTPSGDITGAPGSTIGWGYSIANDDPVNWLVTLGIAADLFEFGTPDGSVFDFPIVPPGATVTQSFDWSNGLGLYAFTWDAGVPPLFANAGAFVVNAEWWDGDPLAGGNFLRAAPDLTAPYSVAVAAAPEPASIGLLMCGAAALLARRAVRRA